MRWRVPVSPGAVSCSPRSAASGDAETPSGTAGEAVPEGDSEQALEWADAQAANIGAIWAARYPSGKDW